MNRISPSSTKLSLNDRFTALSGGSVGGGKFGAAPFGASGKGSLKNRRLLDQLERKHKIKAMKPRRKQIGGGRRLARNLKPRAIIDLTQGPRGGVAGTVFSGFRGGRGRRRNSYNQIGGGTMRADLEFRRSTSVSSVHERLGISPRGRSASRGRMGRSNSASNLRSRSASRGGRNWSQIRGRSGSRNRGRSASRNRQNQMQQTQNGGGFRRRLNRGGLQRRSGSVKSRLGINANTNPIRMRRQMANRRGGAGNVQQRLNIRKQFVGPNNRSFSQGQGRGTQRRGRSQSRGRQQQQRGKSLQRNRSRSRNAQQQQQQQRGGPRRNQQRNGAWQRTGRSRTRRGVSAGRPEKSREQLDAELDAYMKDSGI